MNKARVLVEIGVLNKLLGFPKGTILRKVTVTPAHMLELYILGDDVPDANGAYVSMRGGVQNDGRIGIVFGPVYAPAPK